MERVAFVGFSKSKKKLAFFGWLIRVYMGTPFSHVYIRFQSSIDQDFIYESVGKSGTRFCGSKLWEEHALSIAEFKLDLNDDKYKDLLEYCVSNCGIEYGFFQNIGIFLANMFKLKKNPFKTGQNCSEAIATVLKHQGFAIDKPLDLVTPKDLYNWFNQLK